MAKKQKRFNPFKKGVLIGLIVSIVILYILYLLFGKIEKYFYIITILAMWMGWYIDKKWGHKR